MLTQNTYQQSQKSDPERKIKIAHNPFLDLLRLAIRPQSVPADSPTVSWIKRYPILAAVGLAYILTWIGLIPVIRDPSVATQATFSRANNPAVLVYAFLGVLGCLWAALSVATAVGGVPGRYRLLRGYLKWQAGIGWYLVALLGPVFVLAAAIGLDFLWTGKLPAVPALTLFPGAFVSSYAAFTIRYMFGNFEEICWRASVLSRLQARYSALVSSLIVGLTQGMWHLPYLLVRGHYVQSVGLAAIVIQSIVMGIVATCFYNNTRGSLLMVGLFHAAYNALSRFQGNDVNLFYISIGVWSVAAVALITIFGARYLSRKPPSEIADAINSSHEA